MLFAVPALVIFAPFRLVAGVLVALLAMLAGFHPRSIGWKATWKFLTYELLDVFNPSYARHYDRIIPRSFLRDRHELLYYAVHWGLTPIGVALMVALSFVSVLIVPVVMTAILLVLGIGAAVPGVFRAMDRKVNELEKWADMRKLQKLEKQRASFTENAVCCDDGTPNPKPRTAKLKFQAVKNRVCKPYAR